MVEPTELYELIRQTRTAHLYEENAPIAPSVLEEVIEASLLAPNHRLTFPWKILHVQESTRQALSALARELAREKGQDEEGQKKAMEKVMAPSALLVYVLETKPNNKSEEREDYATLSCSIQLLALGLQAHGYHYKWSTGGLSRHQQTYDLLKIDSSQNEIIGFVWVGKAKKTPSLTKRPPIKEVVRHI